MGACTRAEGVPAIGAEGVPVANGESQVLFHGLSAHDLTGGVGLEAQGIVRIRTFVGDGSNSREVFLLTDK